MLYKKSRDECMRRLSGAICERLTDGLGVKYNFPCRPYCEQLPSPLHTTSKAGSESHGRLSHRPNDHYSTLVRYSSQRERNARTNCSRHLLQASPLLKEEMTQYTRAARLSVRVWFFQKSLALFNVWGPDQLKRGFYECIRTCLFEL